LIRGVHGSAGKKRGKNVLVVLDTFDPSLLVLVLFFFEKHVLVLLSHGSRRKAYARRACDILRRPFMCLLAG
jgi:hypothetical protein